MSERPRGTFEVRNYPNTEPDNMKRCFGHADEGAGGHYVVIDNGGGVDGPWQWGYGVSWKHPNCVLHGTFEQVLTPIDDEARRIMDEVRESQRRFDAECARYATKAM